MSTKELNILVFGYGYLTNAIIEFAQKNNFNLIVVSRGRKVCNFFKTISYEDLGLIKNLNSYYAVSTVPPNNDGDDFVLKTVESEMLNQFLKLIYISSTSVYPGGEVDEDTKTSSSTLRGKIRIDIENKWKILNNSIIIRSAGIYCSKNNLMTRFLNGNYEIISKKEHFTNRIHIEDLVGIIIKIFLNKKPPKLVNASDEDFVNTYEVVKEITSKFDLPNPKKINYTNKKISQSMRSFFEVSKKVKSKYVEKKLNYNFKHKSFLKSLTKITEKLLKSRKKNESKFT